MNDGQPGTDVTSGPQAVWRMFDDSLCKMHYDLGADSAPWSVAHFGGRCFPGIDVFDDQGIGGRKVLRDRADIEADPVDDFLLAIPRSARISLAQQGRVLNCGPGEALLFSTALPFSSAIAAMRPGGRYTQLLARVSGSLLRGRLPQVDILGHHLFEVRTGAGKVLQSLLEIGLAEGNAFSAMQSHHFGEMLIDALANALRDVAAIGDAKKSPRERLRDAALAYIERHLAGPIDVADVAAHCGVSTRYLHAAFADEGLRIGAYVRARRLERARAALRNPAWRGRSVTEIALCSGYADAAHFSRAYKTRYGVTPREDRAAA